ncbi:unnamed protein product [Fusarium graminearum]|uniref:Chromosome 1, complete genome n=1 Tax=Gibberella zeae (strain ATCC MYA-4620 / CBS 123657 / FGSC 9075 / NRRL 31084 / PH-1) TaxID=229533 RepID=I1S5K7_GIBZE|nr:hypothetical protein FGSG_12128 [Fusarium graminearum PH-1]ESU07831.1 hypothetical protein FGSG_12128 [Fusarium graminearum PH-1]CEF74685.1 unnamed protein product [Fusarium graminearum]CZS77962.1 unnamed protein product [Fusarium graminearum]|eukprot:XP_011318316.1 hypothetical protein FGSG_12128 [Fusarium graminearum PH-1]
MGPVGEHHHRSQLQSTTTHATDIGLLSKIYHSIPFITKIIASTENKKQNNYLHAAVIEMWGQPDLSLPRILTSIDHNSRYRHLKTLKSIAIESSRLRDHNGL